MSEPTDQEIIDQVACRHYAMTYVIRNWLADKHKGIKTDYVRRRLMKLEKEGKVCRKPSAYVVQICWGIPQSGTEGGEPK